ncbi:MAG: hypothetical protein ABGX27_04750 [Desulfurobacteriaceae bacterium]
MKRPPYKAYKKREKEKQETPIHIPKEIDTPQAEQLASDVYKVWNFLMIHSKKIGIAFALVLLVLGSLFGYKSYQQSLELKAAKIVDKGIFLLENGKKDDALKLFDLAAKEYPNAPSTKIAKFLLAKERKDIKLLKTLKEQDFITASPSRTLLSGIYIDEGKLKEAKKEISIMRRDKDFTYPEALYQEIIIALKENDEKKAKEILEILRGDYKNLPITSLAEKLLK